MSSHSISKDRKFLRMYTSACRIKKDLTQDEFQTILASVNFDEATAMDRIKKSHKIVTTNKPPNDATVSGRDHGDFRSTKQSCPDFTEFTKAPGSTIFPKSAPVDLSDSDADDVGEPTNGLRSLPSKKQYQDIIPEYFSETSLSESDPELETAEDKASIHEKKTKKQATGNPEPPIRVTNWIGRLAKGAFARKVLVCEGENTLNDGIGQEIAGEDDLAALIDLTCDPANLRSDGWRGTDFTAKVELVGPPIWEDPLTGASGYAAVRADSVVYRPGDFVIVRPDLKAASATGCWYALIVYIFKDENERPQVHLRWMEHGGLTFMAEMAGARELFLLNACDTNPAASIAGLMTVDYRGGDLGVVETDYHEKNHYFYRQIYDEGKQSYETATKVDEAKLGGFKCTCCETVKAVDLPGTTISPGSKVNRNTGDVQSITKNGIAYNIDEFVYLESELNEPYTIAQIKGIKMAGIERYYSRMPTAGRKEKVKVSLEVLTFIRYDDFASPWLVEAQSATFTKRDNRRLVLVENQRSVSSDLLDGKCFVLHPDIIDGSLEEYKDREDTFWVADKIQIQKEFVMDYSLRDVQPLHSKALKVPKDSRKSLYTTLQMHKQFTEKRDKLRALEIFGGCGGLATGLEFWGAVTTKWMVEINTPAATSYSRQFPKAKVYIQDAGFMLQRAIDEESNPDLKDLSEDLSGKLLQRMPTQEEVEVIYGAPPCPDMSGANRFKKVDSFKNTLMATYLSYLDYYRPKYFLLENVDEMFVHRLGAEQDGKHKLKGGIEHGTVKFIMRALTSIGYQAHFGSLQAANFGTPQSRKRFFIWAAAPGYKLPSFPEPTHLSSTQAKLKCPRSQRRSAPHRAVTIGDAITDLPMFDYFMSVPEESASTRKERRDRRQTVRPESVPDDGVKIGNTKDIYMSRPLTEFQRQIRKGVRDNRLLNHYTLNFNEDTLVRILRIPMRPGANHMDLKEEDDMWCFRNGAAPRHGFYPYAFRRLNFDNQFVTCMTRVEPSGKNGTILHPTQHRILTVREFARAQGFPDSFTWDLDAMGPKEMYKQIGNAVAIPVGKALGRELLSSLMGKWKEEQEDRNSNKSKSADDSDFVDIDDMDDEEEILHRPARQKSSPTPQQQDHERSSGRIKEPTPKRRKLRYSNDGLSAKGTSMAEEPREYRKGIERRPETESNAPDVVDNREEEYENSNSRSSKDVRPAMRQGMWKAKDAAAVVIDLMDDSE